MKKIELSKRQLYEHNYYINNKKYHCSFMRQYYLDNIEKERERGRLYYETNKERIKKRHKDRHIVNNAVKNERFHNNPQAKLKKNLRARLNQAIKGSYKSGSAVKDLGCSIQELKSHLESKFTEGMSWNNYAKWHIDHIIPLSSFDLSDREQFLKACHYSNLQPLWAKDNLSKGHR